MSVTAAETSAPERPPQGRTPRRRRRALPAGALVLLLTAAATLAVVESRRGPRFGDPPPLLAVPLDDEPGDEGADAVGGDATAPDPARRGMWMSRDRLRSLPMTGATWEAVERAAAQPLESRQANLALRNEHASRTFAAALVAARTDDDAGRARVRDALRDVVAQEPVRSDVLAAARRLGTYVLAADVIELEDFDPAFDLEFRAWLREVLAFRFDGGGGGGSIVEVHERRANNFGTQAGASRIAAAAYLGDADELARAATVFKGWLGDRESYTGFVFGRLAWQADPDRPVGINPAGATREGHSIDGVLPDDQRRSGRFRWPPKRENYVWGALQGAVVQAHLLTRQGYDAWAWEDEALRRALTWLHDEADYPAEGDDVWVVPLVNAAYGTSFEVAGPTTSESYGYTTWTHAGGPGGG